jgi:hypothetical protein
MMKRDYQDFNLSATPSFAALTNFPDAWRA